MIKWIFHVLASQQKNDLDNCWKKSKTIYQDRKKPVIGIQLQRLTPVYTTQTYEMSGMISGLDLTSSKYQP